MADVTRIGTRARRGPLNVLLVTQSAMRDRLLNALVDHTDPGQVRYAIVTLLAGDGPLVADMGERRVAVRSLRIRDGSLESVPLAVARMSRVLPAARPDVVHSLLFYASLTAELARGMTRHPPPSLLVRHHNAVQHLARRRLHVRLDRWMASRATRVVAVSHAVARTLSQMERVPADHVTVIHNGLDWDRIVRVDAAGVARWRRRFGDRRLLVAAGRMTGAKDYPTLLRAFARVRHDRPDALLVIAGVGPRDDRIALARLARFLGADRAVEFVGWVPEVYDLIAAADVFVQSSIDESLSQTITEARGLGIPVATTTVGGIPEVIGGDLQMIGAGDDARLARRIISQLAEPEAARAEAAGAASDTRKRFSAATMTAGYVALYRRLAQSPADA